MPHLVRYEPSTDQYVDVRLWGTLTQGEFDQAVVGILAAAQEWSRILVDASALHNAGATLTMFMKSDCRGQLPRHVRQAAVVGPSAAAVARTWIRVASEGSAGTQAFAAREPAIEWLLADYQTTTSGS